MERAGPTGPADRGGEHRTRAAHRDPAAGPRSSVPVPVDRGGSERPLSAGTFGAHGRTRRRRRRTRPRCRLRIDLEHPGPLGHSELERVRPQNYWTERVLRRSPTHQLAEVAAGRHERLDGSGHHRGLRVHDLSTVARLPAAADVFAAMTEPPAPTRAQTQRGRRHLSAEAARAEYLCGLTEREVHGLRLAARGHGLLPG
ncbi:HD domain-containing phosphohydrolase [Nocardia sp. CA-145437]|uniref:HD domain-containing phosphohydrolase n=1 Tax=Nocardia sp. CA-145437 TaxID=3239980 RepID=UPI003D995330